MPRKSQRRKNDNSGAKCIEKPMRNPRRKKAPKTKAIESEPEMILGVGDLNDSDSGTSSDSSTWSEFGERILTRGIGTGSGTIQEESSDEDDPEEAEEPPQKIIKIAQPKNKTISSILPQVQATETSKGQISPSPAHIQRPPSPPINPTHVNEEPLDIKPDLELTNDPEEPFQIDLISSPTVHGQIKVEESLEEKVMSQTLKAPPQIPNSKSQSPELLNFTHMLELDVDKHISEGGACKSCLATFNEPNVLRWHVQMTHTKFRSCPFKGCSKGVVHPRLIQPHLKMHTKRSPHPLQFKCTFPGCSFTSNVWLDLLHHEKGAHFSYMTKSKPLLIKALIFTCKYQDCSKTYEKEDSLRSHIRRNHSVKNPKNPKNPKSKSKESKIRRNHSVNLKSKSEESEESKICEKCGQIRRNQKSFKLHLMKCNNPKLPNIYTCNFQGCGKEFKTKENWKIHLDVHQGVYKFLCEFCGIGYPSSAHYENHKVWVHFDLLPLEDLSKNEARLLRLKESKAKHKETYRKKQEELRERETEEERQKRRDFYKEYRKKYYEKNKDKVNEYNKNYNKKKMKYKYNYNLTEEERMKRNEDARMRWANMTVEARRWKNRKKT